MGSKQLLFNKLLVIFLFYILMLLCPACHKTQTSSSCSDANDEIVSDLNWT